MTSLKISFTQLLQYGILALPVAFAGFPLFVLAPDFYATQHALSLTSLGGILLLLLMFDALKDPFLGYFIDRYRSFYKWIMPISAILLCLSIYALFNLLYFSPLIWFGLSMALAVSSYSILTISINAFSLLWTHQSEQQTRIGTVRESSSLLGLLLAVSLPTSLSVFLPTQEVFLYYSLVLLILMIGGYLSFYFWSLKSLHHVDFTQKSSKPSIRINLSSKTMKLFLTYGLSMLASSIPAVLLLFFIRDVLGAKHLTGIFLVLYFLSGALSMPFWKTMSSKYGPYRSWYWAMMLALLSFIWAFFLERGDLWQYASICFVSGLALGAELILPPAILAKQLHEEGNEHQAASHYSVLSFLSKGGLGLASAISLPLLGLVGFTPMIENSAMAILALSAAYGLIPCVIKAGSSLCLYIFFIRGVSNEKHHY